MACATPQRYLNLINTPIDAALVIDENFHPLYTSPDACEINVHFQRAYLLTEYCFSKVVILNLSEAQAYKNLGF